ncbi:MAG TPA: ABC transporter substrate-binding protein [Methylomirabilota bacterium]|nr:ABC transporter substrate-binding protein [Methylomirabilota bacterium]
MPDGAGARKRFLSTVLMTDIVGSTEHASELGDSGWRDLVQMHHALVRAALRRHGGREMDTAGDGFFAVFDAPAAAVDCALEVANAVRKLGIEIRAGVHVGEVEQIAGKVGGISVPIAARIMAAAGPGEVLVSATVRELAAGAGLIFHDRGVRELKGVPGEWHVFAVGLAEPNPAELAGFPSAQERRAAAVRWSEARPFWQRHSRATAGISIGLALLLATGGLLVWRPWQPPALARLSENSIGVIDPERNELIGQIAVGTQPGGIAVGEGFAWVTNTGADTVSQVDLAARSAVNRIPVGRSPTSVVVAGGSVWVTNSGERSVSRISPDRGRVVDTIIVGNGPTAITASGDSLWVANGTDSTVVRIDAQTGELGDPIDVGTIPDALAADADGLWVASEFDSTVSRLDAQTGQTIEVIQIAGRPSAIGLESDSVWVATAEGTLMRIDRDTSAIAATINLGGQLDSIVITDTSLWVGDRQGFVHRLSRGEPSSSPRKVATATSVAALAVVEGNIWVAAQVSPDSHRGGTLRVLLPGAADTDPLGQSGYSVSRLEADGLVGYRRVGGVAGAALLPDLASTIPRPTDGGLTYAFHLRPGIVYSTGDPVRPADFRRAIERSFQVGLGLGVSAEQFFGLIVGSDRCSGVNGPPLRCDLSEGIITDETARTVTFNLSQPDPDFLFKLSMPFAYPVPEGVPMHTYADGAFPGTGPYVVTEQSDTEVRLTRNPHFKVWDPAVRPDGFADEIVFSVVEDAAERLALVENEDADLVHIGRFSGDLFQDSQARFGGQWHIGSNVTVAAWMNSEVPPFDNVKVRQAVNLAIDRLRMADVYGGPPLIAITCQVLPPGFPGYRPYCPYTLDPDAGGHWRAPDLEQAHRLVEESGTEGMHIVVGPNFPSYDKERDYLATVLRDLGYDVSVTDFDHFDEGTDVAAIFPSGWGPDYLAPSIFFGLFTCGSDSGINFCDPGGFDIAYHNALDLQPIDPAAAWAAWADVDRQATDLALWAPLYNAGGDFVSGRVGNYQFSPTGEILFDQMWVQTAISGSSASPSPLPSIPAVPSVPPPNPLEGTWATGDTTCEEQNAAVEAAGFTADQMALGGWSLTCADEPPHGSQFTIIFEAGRLLIFQDGQLGWEGDYRLVDGDTFQAGDDSGYYITYQYQIDGEKLTTDMTLDTCPACDPGADLLGEQIAQTVIYESAPFTKQP